MMEMSCPQCGAGGRIPRNKINARLVCKKCLQVFHVTSGGQTVIGEPPPQKDAPKERAPRERIEFDVSSLEGWGQKLSKIKLPDSKTLGIVGLVLLLTAGCWWLLSRQSVETRTQLIATAIAKGDMETIMGLALPGTEMEAMKWGVDTIKLYTDLKVSLGMQDPVLKIQVQSDTQRSTAQSLVVFSQGSGIRVGPSLSDELQPVPTLASSKKSIELILFWTPDTWGNWRLDAKRTAEAGTPHA
jgi:hypothetical protein